MRKAPTRQLALGGAFGLRNRLCQVPQLASIRRLPGQSGSKHSVKAYSLLEVWLLHRLHNFSINVKMVFNGLFTLLAGFFGLFYRVLESLPGRIAKQFVKSAG